MLIFGRCRPDKRKYECNVYLLPEKMCNIVNIVFCRNVPKEWLENYTPTVS